MLVYDVSFIKKLFSIAFENLISSIREINFLEERSIFSLMVSTIHLDFIFRFLLISFNEFIIILVFNYMEGLFVNLMQISICSFVLHISCNNRTEIMSFTGYTTSVVSSIEFKSFHHQ